MSKLTSADLEQSAERLAFEFYHFELYGGLFRGRMVGEVKCHDAFYQAIGYQFLIHFRALIDFFFSIKRRKADDLLASDFLDSACVDTSFPNPTAPNWVEMVKINLNKRLAHITSTGSTKPGPSMNTYFRHFDEMCQLISSFRAALPADLRSRIEMFESIWARRDSDLRILSSA